MSVARWLPWTVLLAVATVSCVSLRVENDRWFEVGAWSRAYEGYTLYLEQNPNAKDRDRVLFRLGLIQAAPHSELFDPMQAQVLFDQLVRELPRSEWRVPAALIRDFGRAVMRLEQQAAIERDRLLALEGQASSCHEALLQVEVAQRGWIDALRTGLDQERDACDQTLATLRSMVSRHQNEIGRLNEALDALKRIDTEIDTGG